MIHLFHSWKYVRKEGGFREFEGVKIRVFYFPYRVCVKCGKVQAYMEEFLGEGYWYKLPPLETKLLKQMLVDTGDYFEIDHALVQTTREK